MGVYNLRYLKRDWPQYEQTRRLWLRQHKWDYKSIFFTYIFLDSVLSPRGDWKLWWTLIIKISLTMPPFHQLLRFCHSLLSQEWVSVGSKLPAVGRQQPWQVCKWGTYPAGTSRIKHKSSPCCIAPYESRKLIRSKHVLHSAWPKQENFFPPVKHSFILLCLIGALQGRQKKLQGSSM